MHFISAGCQSASESSGWAIVEACRVYDTPSRTNPQLTPPPPWRLGLYGRSLSIYRLLLPLMMNANWMAMPTDELHSRYQWPGKPASGPINLISSHLITLDWLGVNYDDDIIPTYRLRQGDGAGLWGSWDACQNNYDNLPDADKPLAECVSHCATRHRLPPFVPITAATNVWWFWMDGRHTVGRKSRINWIKSDARGKRIIVVIILGGDTARYGIVASF